MTTGSVIEVTILTWIYFLLTGICSVQIVNLDVPEIIKNGTVPYVVLDCDYSYSPSDVQGLVVKWYFNGDPEAVYQWIPSQYPQALGLFKDRLDLRYQASTDPFTVHRALKILNPSTELSGDYTCKVSSFEDEDSVTKKMTVYAPPSNVNIRTFKPTEDSVNVTCVAEGIHPIPDVNMVYYKHNNNKRTPVIVYGLIPEYDYTDGSYNVSVSKNFEDNSLLGETAFECEFHIMEANFSTRKKITYLPGSRSSSVSKASVSSAHGITLYNNGSCLVSSAASIKVTVLLTLVLLVSRRMT